MRNKVYLPFAYIERSFILGSMTTIAIGIVDKILAALNFEGCINPHFRENGIGKVGTTGFVLGIIGGIHLGVAVIISYLIHYYPDIGSPNFLIVRSWSIYMALLCSFHFLEFFVTAVRQANTLSYNSYVVNHGRSYTIAAVFSWLEFWMEAYFFGKWKIFSFLSWIGVCIMLLGQVVRSVAMWTCGDSFSHIIADEKTDEHKLITHGIYSILRHPSYFGWFYWSVGTQLILCNPISTVLYTVAAWYFFESRIPYEEYKLLEFYGEEYRQYMLRTFIGIPYIKTIIPNVPYAPKPKERQQTDGRNNDDEEEEVDFNGEYVSDSNTFDGVISSADTILTTTIRSIDSPDGDMTVLVDSTSSNSSNFVSSTNITASTIKSEEIDDEVDDNNASISCGHAKID